MYTRQMYRAMHQVAKATGYRLTDYEDWTLREAFADVESAEYPVYWGSWSDDELDTAMTNG